MISSLFLLALAASDLSGTWLGQIEVREGVKEDIAFRLVQSGSSLSGKLYGDYQSAPIIKGTVAGDLVSFLVLRQEQAGNEIHETRIRFTGRLVGKQLELSREREGSTRAGSGAAVTYRTNPRHTVLLTRLPVSEASR